MAEVKVVYDFDLKTITVDILVKENKDIVAALPVIPHDGVEWTVTWNLIPGGSNHPIFHADGVEIIAGTRPPDLTVDHPPNEPGGPSWTLKFTNDCDSPNEVRYNLAGNVGDADEQEFNFLKKLGSFLHDPTIAVITDPPTG
jgi:hypothetical protein